MGVNDATHVDVYLLTPCGQLTVVGGNVGKQPMTLEDIVAVGLIARDAVGGKGSGIGDTPLVAGQAEPAGAQPRVLFNLVTSRPVLSSTSDAGVSSSMKRSMRSRVCFTVCTSGMP